MISLCVDARLLGSAGIGRLLKNLLPAFSENFSLSLLCQEKDCEELASYTDRLILMTSPIYSLKEQLELPRKIPSCDLFYAPHFNIPLLPIRAKKRVTTIHDVYHLAHFSELSLPQKLYSKLFYNSALRLSDQVITITEFSRAEIQRFCRVKRGRLNVILNGVSQLFQRAPQPAKDYLLVVGNIKPHKNLYRLLLAYEKANPKEELVIVGEREGFLTQDKRIFALLEKNQALKERVRFTGYLSDGELPPLYSSAKAFLFPSLYEGFGAPPLEAMACGCPVVASNAASIPEVCSDAAEYVDPYDVDSIASGITRVLNDDKRREELIEKGFARVKQFPIERCVSGYLEAFQALVNE